MEAKSADKLPSGDEWQYEPKWDGFRCLAFRDHDRIDLQSKSGQPLGRYFPELVAALLKLKAKQFVIDGEIVVPVKGKFSFDDLLMRIHPAASRVKKLSEETPAKMIVFDLLVDVRGKSLVDLSLKERRKNLDAFAKKYFPKNKSIELSPGFTSSFKSDEKAALTKKLEKLIKPPGFTGNAPGGPSRWATERSAEWQPLAPKLVVEVQYDHFTGGRFRHGTKFLRWRPDKKPAQCKFDQVER